MQHETHGATCEFRRTKTEPNNSSFVCDERVCAITRKQLANDDDDEDEEEVRCAKEAVIVVYAVNELFVQVAHMPRFAAAQKIKMK